MPTHLDHLRYFRNLGSNVDLIIHGLIARDHLPQAIRIEQNLDVLEGYLLKFSTYL